MRSAGCIVNDIADKNFDQKVERTKNRPIASGKVSVKLASTYALILCGIAFLVLINFNKLTILMALISMPLAFTYPLMKRITYWPQLFLGITFNYVLVLAWISISGEISIIPIIFYLVEQPALFVVSTADVGGKLTFLFSIAVSTFLAKFKSSKATGVAPCNTAGLPASAASRTD